MIHAKSTLEGNDYVWANPWQVSDELQAKFDKLEQSSIEDLIL